ncbi:MAG TPA: 2,5-didehydrogluconate reductase [Bacteroidetes bacterium]|nr:2,5-didehydrogluconate reductase [Bacteroidota bacterium]
MKFEEKPVRLGNSPVSIMPLGFGTWAWDSTGQYGTGRDYKEEDLRAAFQTSLKSDINFFDTAESYGNGEVELLLGKFLKESKANVVVATKFPPWRNRFLKRHLLTSLHSSLKRMQVEQIDLYQTHFHFRFVPVQTWMTALADAVEQGLTKAVGTANYDASRLRMAHKLLAKRGVPLASNQADYSLLHRHPETDGVFETCKKLGVTLLAYSPLAQGLLSGKFSPTNPPPGDRGRRYDASYLAKIQPLIGLLNEVGQSHQGKAAAQVALNWVMCKGAIPIHGAKNAQQAEENAGALGWRLTADEVKALDSASKDLQR